MMMRAVAVTELSQVAQARRIATDLAATLGSDSGLIGRVAIVATELASNLIKHGGGGELLLSVYERPGDSGVQLLALDRGPGIADLRESLSDGHSTVAGSAGHGLGAIKRQSALMEVASWPNAGTAILARVSMQNVRPSGNALVDSHGFIAVPVAGEDVSGDACMVRDTAVGRTIMVADGLGHGAQAAAAAHEAVRLFVRAQQEPVPKLLNLLHAGLRPTRGAAVAIARFDAVRPNIVYGGIGNIGGAIVDERRVRRMISLAGTAGHVARRIQTFDYPDANGWVVMHSDGLQTNWTPDRYPGFSRLHPTLIAALLYRDYSRGRDDVTVLVARRAA